MDFRTSWPFTIPNANSTVPNSPNFSTASLASSGTGTIPNIAVWSLYSKFNWQDKVYFSAGLQPLSWGVSKGYFQPADNIFAASTTIDPMNTGAERQGPISIKTTIPLGVTNNFYFYAGLPTTTDANGATTVSMDPGDARFAAKAEYGFGNTELAVAGYYSPNDHPRALLMGTTGIGSWNLFGEGILKYGSERYFLSNNRAAVIPIYNPDGTAGAQQSGDFYFSGTAGGYYFDADSRVTIMLQYYYNGEGQTGVSAQDIFILLRCKPRQGRQHQLRDPLRLRVHLGYRSLLAGIRRRQARSRAHRHNESLRSFGLHPAQHQLAVLRLHEPPARRHLQLRAGGRRVHQLRRRPAAEFHEPPDCFPDYSRRRHQPDPDGGLRKV